MTPRLAWVLLAAAAVVGLIALVVMIGRDGPRSTAARNAAAGDADKPVEDAGDARPVRVALYFPGANGRLVREERELEFSADGSTFAARIVEALLQGPQSEAPFAPFPSGVTLGEVHVDDAGTAYVDLRSAEHPSPPFAGTTAEMLALYSLVNSVVTNVEGARALVVLWNGRQPRTFGGHIDTTRPLVPATHLEAS